MKKIILVFALLFSLTSFAQFPGKYTELLLGKEVKVNNGSEIGFYFYTQKSLGANYNKNNIGGTKPETVVGRTFKIEDISPNLSHGTTYYWMKLSDSKETLFINYDSDTESTFPFTVIGGLQIPKSFYCDYIEVKTDKFSGETIYIASNKSGITFIKIIKGDAAKYYMSINAPGSTLGKGATVLLKNAKKIEKPNALLEMRSINNSITYFSVLFELTLSDVKLLIDNEITDIRVGNYDDVVYTSSTLKGMFGCLIEKK